MPSAKSDTKSGVPEKKNKLKKKVKKKTQMLNLKGGTR